MSFSDTRYIQVEAYDAPDRDNGLWGQVCALMSEDRYERFHPYPKEIQHVPIEDTQKYYAVPFPKHAERDQMTPWVRAFERAYFGRDRRETKIIK